MSFLLAYRINSLRLTEPSQYSYMKFYVSHFMDKCNFFFTPDFVLSLIFSSSAVSLACVHKLLLLTSYSSQFLVLSVASFLSFLSASLIYLSLASPHLSSGNSARDVRTSK